MTLTTRIFAVALALPLCLGVGCTRPNHLSILVPPAPQPAPELPPAPPDAHGPEAKSNLIVVESPKPGDFVASPLTVTGKARGNWYFEASFPVELQDVAGHVVASGPAQAQGEWMTTEFVPFKIVLAFDASAIKSSDGWLILRKDNPSGLPEHEDHLRFPVVFKSATKTAQGDCRPTGCSSQVCADEDVVTTCEYREEYACYKSAACERQTDGKCGWTPSPALSTCLNEIAGDGTFVPH